MVGDLAAAISTRMTGLFAQPVEISGTANAVLPHAAAAVDLIGCVAALRRAVSSALGTAIGSA